MEATLQLRHFQDVLGLLAALSRRTASGDTLVFGFDTDRVLQVGLPIDVTDHPLLEWVELLCEVFAPGEGMLVVSNRNGETPADRPTDGADWQQLAGACDRAEVVLLDWFVLSGTYAFSLSELGEHPPGWRTWGIADPYGATERTSRCRRGA